MTQLVPLRLEDGSEILIEVEEVRPVGPQPYGREPDKAGKVTATLEKELQHVKPALKRIVEALESLSPEEIGVRLGLKVNGDARFFIAKAGAEANFEVTLYWRRKPGFSDSPA